MSSSADDAAESPSVAYGGSALTRWLAAQHPGVFSVYATFADALGGITAPADFSAEERAVYDEIVAEHIGPHVTSVLREFAEYRFVIDLAVTQRSISSVS